MTIPLTLVAILTVRKDALAHLRAAAVLHSEVLAGVDGPDYAAG